MKALFPILLFVLYVGCSSHTSVDQLQNKPSAQPMNLIATAAATPSPAQTPQGLSPDNGSAYTAKGIESKLGVVSRTYAGFGCLRILNATLKASDEFYIVVPYEKPHEVLKLRIKEKVSRSCVDDDSDIGDGENVAVRSSYYLAELAGGDDQGTVLSGIGVVGLPKAPKIENGSATAELTGSPPSEYFRECSSHEGMHLTVWTGKPLSGKRVWHRYFYLHYDTDPNCKRQDYEGTED